MKKILFILFSIICSANAYAEQQPIDSIFRAMPYQLLPLLDHNQKMNLLDLYNYQRQSHSFNLLDGKTGITTKSPSQLTLALTPVSHWQLKILPWVTISKKAHMGNHVYSIVHQYNIASDYATLEFYNEAWQPILIEKPQPPISAFLQSQQVNTDSLTLLERQLENIAHLTYLWNSEQPILRVELSIKGLDKNWQDYLQNKIHPLYYRWENDEFQTVKDELNIR